MGCEPELSSNTFVLSRSLKIFWYIRIQDNKIPYIAKSIFFQANEHNIGQNYLPISLRKYSEDSIKSPVGMEAWFMNFSTILKHVCTTIPLSRSLKIFWCIHIQDNEDSLQCQCFIQASGHKVSYPTRWSLLFIFLSLYGSPSKQQRNIVQLCTTACYA